MVLSTRLLAWINIAHASVQPSLGGAPPPTTLSTPKVAAALHEQGIRSQHLRLPGSGATTPELLAWRSKLTDMHNYPRESERVVGTGLNVRDFGAIGAGVCREAADRSWTKCSGPDESTALQHAIDAAQHMGRALFLPAGIYMVNRTLVCNFRPIIC
eukprot:SAG31_NODE_1136_length_9734_cov_4.139595_1_plen_157_part_00